MLIRLIACQYRQLPRHAAAGRAPPGYFTLATSSASSLSVAVAAARTCEVGG